MAAFDFGSKVDPQLFDKYSGTSLELHVRDYLDQAWKMFKEHVGEFVGFTLIIFVASAVSSRMNFAGSIVISAITTSFYAGYAIAAFRLLGGQTLQFSDFFKGFNYFLPLFLAGLAGGFLVCIGLFLLIIPGIYIGVCYMFTTFLIIDYRMEFWQAMETSRKIISRHWFAFFGFAFILFAINMLGVLALGIGTLVSIPVSACASAIAYRELIGLYSADW
ncbi:MAG: hypothetical protein HGA62_01890 [Chlorobiaceae bacterium]|nr:hypothetical protein [Chlorobiaceae bacterium]NTV59686.1 hypothetical protein [Chlorobiaceae bacterium]